jgi:hypothetical protein
LKQLDVKMMDASWCRQILVVSFSQYNEWLPDDQQTVLLSTQDAVNQGYVAYVVQLGTARFRLVLNARVKLRMLPGDLVRMIRLFLLAQWGSDLLQAALSVIASSRFGLSEMELRQPIATKPTLTSDAKLAFVKKQHEDFHTQSDSLPMIIVSNCCDVTDS